MSDVPLGVFLSGGIDSSAIAALMARMIDRPLQTFSVAFKAAGVQRAASTRAQVAHGDRRRRARDRHRRARLLRRAAAADLARGRADRASRRACRCTSCRSSRGEHVTVVLTGEGSDELLAGYGKYPRVAAQLARRTRLRADCARARSARRSRAASCRALPRRARPLRRRSFLGDRPRAGVDVLRQLRRRSTWPGSARCCRRALRAAGRRASGAYGSSMAYFNAPERRAARCSIGCSTPT